MGWNHKDSSTNVYLPWDIGNLYYQHGFEDHKRILSDIMDQIIGRDYILETNAPENVEIFFKQI